MKLGVLYSGGKDSTLAVIKAGCFEDVACLITVKPENADSYFFHTPNTHLASLLAEAIGIPIIEHSSKGIENEELLDLKKAILNAMHAYNIEGIVTGAVESVYQAQRVQRICLELGLWCFNPLWKLSEEELLQQAFKHGFRTTITSVAAGPLGPDLLGKELDNALYGRLLEFRDTYGTSLIGEGGEFETIVLDADCFKKRLVILDSEPVWDGRSGKLNITRAKLEDK